METSLSAVTGLTIGCARCHDHKFDPILQKDYYKLMASYQAVWDPENWLAGNLKYRTVAQSHGLDMEPAKRDAWIKDVTSSGAKALRRMEDQREAAYQRYRAELKAGRELTPELRAQIRKDIEADPDLDVDRNVPKDFITDQELEKRFPELPKWKDEIAAKRYSRGNPASARITSRRPGIFRRLPRLPIY
jgi:hypothetical protein